MEGDAARPRFAPFGAHECFIGLLIEHYARNFQL